MATATPAPTTPAELFNGIADIFEANPGAWQQDMWGYRAECGTYACIAGWTVLLRHGDTALVPDPNGADGVLVVAQDWKDGSPAPCGEGEHVSEYAGLLLGLSDEEMNYLFDGDWVPSDDEEGGRPVVAALRAMADGARPSDVGYHY